jgi:uncharacterized membrane protein
MPSRAEFYARPPFHLGIAACAAAGAVLGNAADSLLGSTVQGKFRVTNTMVNLLSTAFGAAAGALLARMTM